MMISVTQALDKVLAMMSPLPVVTVPLRQASGRVLAQNVSAGFDQPPFAASAMDGYAIRSQDIVAGAKFTVIGTSAAGDGFSGQVLAAQAVRIFTGAPVPSGADRVVIQEDVARDGDVITIQDDADPSLYIRPVGDDFKSGDSISAPRRLTSNDIALLAAMNVADVPVRRKPVIALVATGDELVMPGETPGPDQIIAANNFGLAALCEHYGAESRLIPIARDTPQSLQFALELCAGADLIVTIGGASVGDFDIVHDVAIDMGLETGFYNVCMRPGKPLMAGRLQGIPMIGLPGNPVSSMVCGHVFMRPAISRMLGFEAEPLARDLARLGGSLPQNGGREHYMRANIGTEYGQLTVHPAARQDSALLSVFAASNALIVRAPHDPARAIGDRVEIIRL